MRFLSCFAISVSFVLLPYCSAASADKKVDKEKTPRVIKPFDGKTLEGWDFFLEDPTVKMEDVWSVKEGAIVCTGTPMGYLVTKKKFKDYKLTLEWRWAPGKDPGNSGIFLQVTGKPMVIPRCIEAQLKSGSAGDAFGFRGLKISGPEDRFFAKEHAKLGPMTGVLREGSAGKKSYEKEPGQWNALELNFVGDKLEIKVNGQVANVVTGGDNKRGAIGLQSEGGEVHFRNIEVTPVKTAKKK